MKDSLNRVNTGDNTPAIIYYNIIEGDELKITVWDKGVEWENMSKLEMMNPFDRIETKSNKK